MTKTEKAMENVSRQIRRKLYESLKMQQLNCEETDMFVITCKTDMIIMYAIYNGENVELYFGKN